MDFWERLALTSATIKKLEEALARNITRVFPELFPCENCGAKGNVRPVTFNIGCLTQHTLFWCEQCLFEFDHADDVDDWQQAMREQEKGGDYFHESGY